MFQQRQRFGNGLVHVHVAEFAAAGAGKIQQVVDDLRSPERLAGNPVQQAHHLLVAAHVL